MGLYHLLNWIYNIKEQGGPSLGGLLETFRVGKVSEGAAFMGKSLYLKIKISYIKNIYYEFAVGKNHTRLLMYIVHST